MKFSYKQRCVRCRKNLVLVTSGNKYPICYECQKDDLKGQIKDPKMKKMFNIPEKFYKDSSFLRSIKINYLKYGKLTEKQIEYFKKVVEEIKTKKE